MDAVIVDGALSDLIRVGAPVIHTVVKRGRVVHGTKTKNEERRTRTAERGASNGSAHQLISAGIPRSVRRLVRRSAFPVLALRPSFSVLRSHYNDSCLASADHRRPVSRRPRDPGADTGRRHRRGDRRRDWRVAAERWSRGCRTRGTIPTPKRALATARTALVGIRDRLVTLADVDTEAFDQVMAAYRLPKATDAEKAARKQAIQPALGAATDAPLETLRTAADALAQARAVAAFGNPSAASDVRRRARAARDGGARRRAPTSDQPGGLTDEATQSDGGAAAARSPTACGGRRVQRRGRRWPGDLATGAALRLLVVDDRMRRLHRHASCRSPVAGVDPRHQRNRLGVGQRHVRLRPGCLDGDVLGVASTCVLLRRSRRCGSRAAGVVFCRRSAPLARTASRSRRSATPTSPARTQALTIRATTRMEKSSLHASPDRIVASTAGLAQEFDGHCRRRDRSVDLVQQPIPARSREEVGNRGQPAALPCSGGRSNDQ